LRSIGEIMSITPENRHLLVAPIEEAPTADNTVQLLMPDDFRPPQSPYVVCEVLDVAQIQSFITAWQEK
jgi:hypothetical protein